MYILDCNLHFLQIQNSVTAKICDGNDVDVIIDFHLSHLADHIIRHGHVIRDPHRIRKRNTGSYPTPSLSSTTPNHTPKSNTLSLSLSLFFFDVLSAQNCDFPIHQIVCILTAN